MKKDSGPDPALSPSATEALRASALSGNDPGYVERVAMAICETGVFDDAGWRNPEAYSMVARAAIAAMRDAILADFDRQLDIYEQKKDQAFNAKREDRFERFENYRDAVDNMRANVEAMIDAALGEPTKAADPGIPVYHLSDATDEVLGKDKPK